MVSKYTSTRPARADTKPTVGRRSVVRAGCRCPVSSSLTVRGWRTLVEFGDYSSTLLAIASTIGLFVLSGVVPIVNAEVSVILLGSVAPPRLLPLLLVIATLSHMVGKSLTYLAGRWAERWGYAPLQRRVAAVRAKLEGRSALGGTIIFISAATGLPPFYVVSVGSGIVRFSFLHYFAFGFAGRLVRFAALLLIPQLARVLMPTT